MNQIIAPSTSSANYLDYFKQENWDRLYNNERLAVLVSTFAGD